MHLNKNAVVTGATKGIGRAVSDALVSAGYRVFGSYHQDEDAASEMTETLGDSVDLFKSDLSTIEGVQAFAGHVSESTDSIDAVVLNVGTTCRKSFREITYAEWNQVMNTNLTLPFFLLQDLYEITAQNSRIVAISSILSIHAHSLSIPYGVSKAGLNQMVKSLVKVYRDKNATVNAICPGFVETDWHKSKTESHRASINGKIALGRFARPSELAHMVLSIIENGYMNGSVVQFDGGYSYQ